jgi:hypothetical protein
VVRPRQSCGVDAACVPKRRFMPRNLILLELNELCPALLHKWMAAGKLPNFKRFHDASQVYLTLADAEPPALEPWIQWYSIHTGLSFEQHKVFRLTDGWRANHPDIWTVLQTAGLKTASCSSMNAKGSRVEGSFFLPDPWSTGTRPFPDELEVFHRFVSSQVREHTSPQHGLRPHDMLAFGRFIASRGLSLPSIMTTVGQLSQEVFSNGASQWKRVIILDLLQFDIFKYYFLKLKPDFSTFFLNSTAHLQHAYWRHMDPDAFKIVPDDEDLSRFGDSILYGYQKMDKLISRFFDLEERGVTLALATGLSQKPFLKYEDVGGQKFYRPRDIEGLLRLLGIYPKSVESLMGHEFILHFETEVSRTSAAQALTAVSCEGKRVFDIETDHSLQLYLGSILQDSISSDAKMKFNGHSGEILFHNVFYLISETKSGCHDPNGLLWFKFGQAAHHEDVISILDIFPTVIEFLKVDYHPTEQHPYKGRSRVSDWRSVQQDLLRQ